jgi:hypothetical protein
MLSKDRKDGSECEMVTFLGVYRIGAREGNSVSVEWFPERLLHDFASKGKRLRQRTLGALHRKDRQGRLLSRWQNFEANGTQ